MPLDPIPAKHPGQSNFNFWQWIWGLVQTLNDDFRPGLGDRLRYLGDQLDRG